MDNNTIDDMEAAFGQHEGICEAGIFALTPDGWELLRRRRFTQTGTALAWAKEEIEDVHEQYEYSRLRMSVLSQEDGQKLEDVLAEYELKRKSGDPDFNELPRPKPVPPEIRKAWRAHMEDIENTGPCEAYVCAELFVGDSTEFKCMYRKSFSRGTDAHKWAEYYESKLYQRKSVKAFGTVFSVTPMTNEEAAKDFQAQISKDRDNRNN